jgi:hypothetical protein
LNNRRRQLSIFNGSALVKAADARDDMSQYIRQRDMPFGRITLFILGDLYAHQIVGSFSGGNGDDSNVSQQLCGKRLL